MLSSLFGLEEAHNLCYFGLVGYSFSADLAVFSSVDFYCCECVCVAVEEEYFVFEGFA